MGGAMITIKLMGGLGNQLWGYGLGRSLGQTQEVQFDVSGYDPHGKRKYSLDRLGLTLPLGRGRGQVVNEKNLRFDPSILGVEGDKILIGYWQAPQYLESAKSRILSELFVGTKLSEGAAEILNLIDENMGFIHVRRGDYLQEPHKSFHGNLTLDYYKDAVSLIQSKNPNAKFLVFSDDVDWCLTNLSEHYIVGGANEFDSLQLMSKCKYAVTANSSFSFWGAWLGADKQQGGIVIAPEYWFQNVAMREQSQDIVPQRWVRLAN
jgi:hypothetical protein